MTARSTASSATESETAVRAVFDAATAAWAQGDTEVFVGCYSDAATVILPGIYLPDREAVRTGMGAAFAGPLRASRRVHDVQSIRFPTPDTAVAITKSVTVFPGADTPRDEQWEWSTWVLVRSGGRWRFEACHACPQQAA
jgi:uncharacterized protein (TIGR02246 family)